MKLRRNASLAKNIESDSIITRTKRTGNFRLINALEKSLDEIFRNKLYSDLQISVLVQKKFSLQRTVTPIKITRGKMNRQQISKRNFYFLYFRDVDVYADFNDRSNACAQCR